MNTEKAQLILATVHDQTDGETDEEILEALALLESDADLRGWLEKERAFDSAVRSKLAQIEPPADLKATLIELLGRDAPGRTMTKKQITWLRPPLLAAAAAIILIPLLAIPLLTGRASAKSFDSFRNDMVEFAVSDFKLDHHEQDLPKLYAWLNAVNATCPTELPDCLGCSESIGCKVVEWDEQSVTLICLRNSTKQVVHCFVVPRAQFKKLPDENHIRETLSLNDLETCGWTDQDNVYLLVGSDKGVKVTAPME